MDVDLIFDICGFNELLKNRITGGALHASIYLNAGSTISLCLSFSTYYFCMYNERICARLS